jgi:phosphoribosylamine---glycine ligase
MNILILGGGGREHALAWAVRQNPKCDRLIVAPGNPGMEAIAERADLDPADGDAVAALAAEAAVDLVIVGPEAPLVAGVADRLRAEGVAVFGPSAAAAMLEASKAFAREVADAAGAAGPAWARFDALEPALAHVRGTGAPIVVKADGLAAGKGVTVAATLAEAEEALRAIFAGGPGSVVVEEVLRGEEASFFVLCDGTTALPCGTAQDHKRVGEGDRGPNTGGMGAYSPAPILTPEVEARAMEAIVRPVLAEMARRGTPFNGVLYAGLMIEDGTPRLVEFNVRFGDPEAQVLLMRLGGQALDLLQATAEGRLGEMAVHWADDHALCVVMAAEGYPGPITPGARIEGTDALPQTSREMLFHAGTGRRDGRLVATGGRVLGATARAESLREARDAAYALVDRINAPGLFCRRDIGWRAL